MLMTDNDIRKAIKDNALEITNLNEDSFKSLAYVARLGERALVGGAEEEIKVNNQGGVALKAGDFVLFNTAEKFKLSDRIAGHIGTTSYYARKGLVLLAGMHVHPEWDGHLVLGAYNASPRDIVLDYLSPLIAIEFHQLSSVPHVTAKKNLEQQKGLLPRVDKDFLRTMETQSLSQVSEELRKLAISSSNMQKEMRIMQWVMGIGFTFLALMVALD